MAYQFLPGKSVGKRTRKIVRGQIDKAIGELCDSSDIHKGVHDARKRLKKIRAVLRLVRDDLGKSYTIENHSFRDAGQKLSTLRDAEALIETFDLLMRSAHAPDDRDGALRVREALLERREAIAGARLELQARIDEVVRELRAARRRIEGWPVTTRNPAALYSGYRRTYEAGRDAFKVAYAEGTSAAFHEWRKHAKYHLYHTRLLRPLWPAVMEARADELSALAELLGDHHNLAVFHQTLHSDAAPFRGPEAEALVECAARLRRELERRARPLGERMYAEKPGALERRIKAYWKAAVREHHARTANPNPVAPAGAAG